MRHFAAFLSLVMAQALRNGPEKYHWVCEGWEDGYVFELRLALEGITYDEWERDYYATEEMCI